MLLKEIIGKLKENGGTVLIQTAGNWYRVTNQNTIGFRFGSVIIDDIIYVDVKSIMAIELKD